MTGAGTSAAHGLPDYGLLTMSEMVDNARRITGTIELPLISDSDTGYGNELNAFRTVQEFERAGVAAIHIEDQVFPKKCGHLLGKRLIPIEEAVQKIRAAVDARRDPDFVIIARCDALMVAGMEEAVRRGRAYLEAGADMLFIESPRTMAEIEEIPRRLPGLHLFNMASSGKTPFLSIDEVGRLGYKVMILPNFATLAAIKAMREVLTEIKRTGTAAGVLDRCASFQEFCALGGLGEVQELEARFGVPEQERTAI
jgi:2-methylisocitrate lyase-like PEP mutase family enzyme